MKKKKRILSKKRNLKKVFKGFTLVELLAVIVILAIIMIISIPSVISVMKASRQKSFIEYVQKIRNLGEQYYLNDQLTNTTMSECTMYDIEKDLGLDNTGSYHGYVVAVKRNNDIHYYITLYDENYMIYGIEYDDSLTTSALLDYSLSAKDTLLTKDYLAGVAGCSIYTNKSDGSTGNGTDGATGSGTSTNISDDVVSKKLKLGDYVNYYPTSTSYTVSAVNSGYPEDVTINPSELTSWRVLKINDNGTVDIISTYLSSSDIYLGNLSGYVKSVNTLQNVASAYINSTYSSSARCIGYNGQTLVINNSLDVRTPPWTTSTYQHNNDYESLGGGDTLYLADTNQMETAGISLKASTSSGSFKSYWVSSREYFYGNNFTGSSSMCTERWSFNIRFVHVYSFHVVENTIYQGNSCDSNITKQYFGHSFRPIVTLKSNVKIISGSGKTDDPYEITI